MAINLPKKATLEKQRKDLRENGLVYELPYTSIGEEDMFTMRMRYVSTMDKAVIEAMPAQAQKQVFDGMRSIERSTRNHKDPNSLLEALSNNEEQLRAADLLFCAAAWEPVVVMTEEEAAGDDSVYPVTAFAAEDRLGFLMATIGGNQELAKRLKLFRPESGPDVQDGEAGGLAEKAAVRLVEPAEAVD